MKREINKFLFSVAFFVVLSIALGFTKNQVWQTVWGLLLFLGALPAIILCWFDLGRALRNTSEISPRLSKLKILFSLPLVFFGLLSVLSGIAVIIWAVYYSLHERHLAGASIILMIGAGPLITLIGVIVTRDAIIKYSKNTDIQKGNLVYAKRTGKTLNFVVSVLVVLLIAAGITYKFGVPLLENSTYTCSSGGVRNYGCGTGFGEFLTILAVVVIVVISLLWKKFRDY